MTLDELLSEYVESNPAIRSANTERLLRVVVNSFSKSAGNSVEDLTARNIVAYMRARRLLGRAEATVTFEGAKLRAIASFAAQRGYIKPLALKIIRPRPDTPKALLKFQIRSLFEAAQKNTRPIGGVDGAVYFVALLSVIWDTGERIGAVHQLARNDIDLLTNEVTFRVRKGKGRTISKPIRKSTAAALKALLDASPGDKPFAVVVLTSLYHHQNRLLALAGIPPERRNKFHALRRSHASYLKAAGGDARDALDHSSEEITNDYYIDPRVTREKSAIDRLFSPWGFWREFAGRVASWFAWGVYIMVG